RSATPCNRHHRRRTFRLVTIRRNRFGAEVPVVAGQALAGGDVELPTVKGAGEDPVLDLPEAGQVGLQVRAAALDAVPTALPRLLLRLLLGVEPLGVLDALGREALEKAVDILVVRTVALRRETAGEKNLVHPILVVPLDARLDERRVEEEPVLA